MPKIREYQRQVDNSGRLNVRPAQGSPVGAAIAGFGQTVGGIAEATQKRSERKDLSTLQVELARARSELTTQLKERVRTGEITQADMNEKFDADMLERVNALQEGMETRVGQQAAQQHGNELAISFRQATAESQAIAQGTLEKDNYLDAMDAHRNTLIEDPLQFNSVLSESTAILNDPNGQFSKIPAEKRRELLKQTRSELARSAVQGLIENVDPEVARKQLNDGKFDAHLDADDKAVLIAKADTAIRGKEVELARLEAQKEKLAEKEREITKDKFVAAMNTPEGNTLSVKEVLTSNLKAAEQEHFIALIKKTNAGGAKANGATVQRLFDRIHLPPDDKRKIKSETELYPYFGRGLDFVALNHLRKELKDIRNPENISLNETRNNFLKAVKKQITKSTMFLTDPQGDAQYYSYWQYVLAKQKEARDNGEDPFELFDPRSKKFLGSQETLNMFARSPNQVMNEMAEGMRRPPGVIDWPKSPEEARMEGETAQQYLDRMRQDP